MKTAKQTAITVVKPWVSSVQVMRNEAAYGKVAVRTWASVRGAWTKNSRTHPIKHSVLYYFKSIYRRHLRWGKRRGSEKDRISLLHNQQKACRHSCMYACYRPAIGHLALISPEAIRTPIHRIVHYRPLKPLDDRSCQLARHRQGPLR